MLVRWSICFLLASSRLGECAPTGGGSGKNAEESDVSANGGEREPLLSFSSWFSGIDRVLNIMKMASKVPTSNGASRDPQRFWNPRIPPFHGNVPPTPFQSQPRPQFIPRLMPQKRNITANNTGALLPETTAVPPRIPVRPPVQFHARPVPNRFPPFRGNHYLFNQHARRPQFNPQQNRNFAGDLNDNVDDEKDASVLDEKKKHDHSAVDKNGERALPDAILFPGSNRCKINNNLGHCTSRQKCLEHPKHFQLGGMCNRIFDVVCCTRVIN